VQGIRAARLGRDRPSELVRLHTSSAGGNPARQLGQPRGGATPRGRGAQCPPLAAAGLAQWAGAWGRARPVPRNPAGARPWVLWGCPPLPRAGHGPRARPEDGAKGARAPAGGAAARGACAGSAGPPQHCPSGGCLRGRAVRAPGAGIVCRRRALRPDRRACPAVGELRGLRGGRGCAALCADPGCRGLSACAGRGPPGPEAGELPLPCRRAGGAAEACGLWSLCAGRRGGRRRGG